MDDNRVKVRIYGQEYTISGERDEETIMHIANYVDEKMREIGRFATGTTPGSLATLACVNVADELFQERDEVEKLKAEKYQLEKDAQHYMKMWDDAKQNFIQYKEGAKNTDMEKNEAEQRIKELEEKCNEFENSYFDLQMENMQIKAELDKLKSEQQMSF